MKEFILDGENFDNLSSFYDEAQKKLCPEFAEFGHNLNAFSDILAGGFGAFNTGEPIKLIWKHSEKSKKDLSEKFATLIEIIKSNKNVELYLD